MRKSCWGRGKLKIQPLICNNQPILFYAINKKQTNKKTQSSSSLPYPSPIAYSALSILTFLSSGNTRWDIYHLHTFHLYLHVACSFYSLVKWLFLRQVFPYQSIWSRTPSSISCLLPLLCFVHLNYYLKLYYHF